MKHFLLSSMLKSVKNITLKEKHEFFNIMHFFTVIYYQFYAFFQNKYIYIFFFKSYWLQTLKNTVNCIV